MIKSNKKFFYCIAIFFLLLFITLSGCFEPRTEKVRTPVTNLVLSLDGTKLISIEGDYNNHKGGSTEKTDYQIWNASSGEIIIKDIGSYYIPTSLSPGGNLMVTGSWIRGSISLSQGKIFNVTSGEKLANFSDFFIKWSKDGRYFLTSFMDWNELRHNITLWDSNTFTKISTVSINRYEYLYTYSFYSPWFALSPAANKVVCINGLYGDLITVFNLSNGTCQWDKNILQDEYRRPISEIEWTNNDEIKVFYYLKNNLTLISWNASAGELLPEQRFDELSGMDKVLFSSNGETYAGCDYETNSVKIFNISGIQNTIQFDSYNSTEFVWSSEGNIVVMGNNSGIIEIRNVSTGILIHKLETPMREISYTIPFPSIAYLFLIVIVLILFRKQKDRKK